VQPQIDIGLSAGGRINCGLGGVYRLRLRRSTASCAGQQNKGERAMAQAEAKLLIPGLAGFYDWSRGFSDVVVRLAAGGILFVHGWIKFNAGLTPVVGAMTKNGFFPAEVFAGSAMFLETIGAICIIIGLFTRFFAAAIAIELFCVTFFVSYGHGFAFSAPGGGYEFPLLWGLVFFAIALRGGGHYSVDRMIGKEL
jgi:putative oxidoreductase